MSVMNHSFNVDVAEKFGIEEAVILEGIFFWCFHNWSNRSNIKDGRAWVYNSVAAWHDQYPYMSESKISRALKNLEEGNLIMTGCFGGHDRTKWYALTDEAEKIYGRKCSGMAKDTVKKDESCEKQECRKESVDINREDIAKIEKAYEMNCMRLVSKKVIPKAPEINRGSARRLVRLRLAEHGVELVEKALKNGMKNQFCIEKGYSLTVILSKGVFASLTGGHCKT